MSTDSKAAYKSRLFNFLNRQTLRLNDNWGKAMRHAKVAAVWGVQILLYPAYLLVQAGRLAGKQLERNVSPTQLPETTLPESSAADVPLENVLSTVADWLPEAKLNPNQELNLKLEQIQGIAVLREQKKLVLVAHDNQILDVLNPRQQRQLQKRIIWEVADYWRQQRLALDSKFFRYLPKPPTDNENLLPPARIFWQTVSWLQTSAIASAINLFGESSLVARQSTEEDSSELSTSPLPQKTLALIDQTIANLESQSPLQSLRIWQQNLQSHWQNQGNLATSSQLTNSSLQDLIWAAFDYFFNRLPQKSLTGSLNPQLLYAPEDNEPLSVALIPPSPPQIVKAMGNQLQTFQEQIQPANQGDSLNLLILIQAALDYFFGPTSQNSLPQTTDFAQLNQAQSPLTKKPWLTWSDLFSPPETSSVRENTTGENLWIEFPPPLSSPSTPQLNGATPAPESPLLKNPVISEPSGLIKKKEAKSSTPVVSQPQNETIVKAEEESEQQNLKSAPSWIETEATPVGYVKHPLVQIIEWLDLAMLWFEELVVKLLQWLRRQF